MINAPIKILVTGGAGFIGSNFVHYIVDKFDKSVEVTVLDKMTYAGSTSNLKEIFDKINFVVGDICSPQVSTLIQTYKPQTIINFAAETHVDNSIGDSGAFVQTNILGTKNLLDAMLINKDIVHRFVQISTDEVYGHIPKDNQLSKFDEMSPLKPRNPYSASKAAAEHFCNAYFHTYGLDIVITRSSNNFGPRQHIEKLVPKAITKALNNQTIPIYGYGEQMRDWIYVGDNCKAIWKIAQQASPGQVFNIGTGHETSNLDIVGKILSILGKGINLIEFVPDRPGHDFKYSLSIDKIIDEIQWEPCVDLDEGLQKTILWYNNLSSRR